MCQTSSNLSPVVIVAPPATTSMDSLASMFGAIFYFVGGAAGMGAVAASAAATRAVSQSSRLGVREVPRVTALY